MDNSFVTLQNKSIDIPLKIHDKEKDVIDIYIYKLRNLEILQLRMLIQKL